MPNPVPWSWRSRPDGGINYLTKAYDPEWLADRRSRRRRVTAKHHEPSPLRMVPRRRVRCPGLGRPHLRHRLRLEAAAGLPGCGAPVRGERVRPLHHRGRRRRARHLRRDRRGEPRRRPLRARSTTRCRSFHTCWAPPATSASCRRSSASFYEPFTAARLLSTLQHFAHGRLGFNVVTSGSDLAAQNYGLDKQVEHDLRYDRADEWVDVVRQPLAQLGCGRHPRRHRARRLRRLHQGAHRSTTMAGSSSVRGPLNTVPAAEEPVMVQAGASGRGRDFAGKNSDVILALASTAERMREYRDSIRRGGGSRNGRDPDAVKVLFVVNPVVTANADETAAVGPRVPNSPSRRSTSAAVDLVPVRRRLQEVRPRCAAAGSHDEQQSGHPRQFREVGARRFDAARDPAGRAPAKTVSRSSGTADEIADHLGELGEAVGGDGFLFTGQVHPANVHRTLDTLVPALRRRGLIRTGFGGGGTAPEPAGVLAWPRRPARWVPTLRRRRTSSRSPMALRVEIGRGCTPGDRSIASGRRGAIAAGRPVYGLNTRLGAGRDDRVGDDELLDFQRLVIANHRGGVGRGAGGAAGARADRGQAHRVHARRVGGADRTRAGVCRPAERGHPSGGPEPRFGGRGGPHASGGGGGRRHRRAGGRSSTESW